MAVRCRLSDADAAKYAYGDEWYTFDKDALMKLPASMLIPLETEMDYSLGELISDLARRSTQAMKASFWIARKLVHPDIEKFKDFDPAIWDATTEMPDVDEVDDAVPLDPGSPEPEPSPATS